jgi:hypothetical protein
MAIGADHDERLGAARGPRSVESWRIQERWEKEKV